MKLITELSMILARSNPEFFNALVEISLLTKI